MIVTPRETMFRVAGIGCLWKNTSVGLNHNRLSGSLLDFSYQNKNQFKPSSKTAWLCCSYLFFCQNGPKAYSLSLAV